MTRAIGIMLAAVCAAVVFAQNPHDGYAFWLPCGELRVGDAASEKEFRYVSGSSAVPASGVTTFTVRPRQTRFDIPMGQIVLVRPGKVTGAYDLSVEGVALGKLGAVTFVPATFTKGKREVKVEVRGTLPRGTRIKVYYTDDADKLGVELVGDLSKLPTPGSYRDGVLRFWEGAYPAARARLLGGVTPDKTPAAASLLRRLARWAAAYEQFAKIKTGRGYYDLGLFCMYGGYWDLAVDSFRRATELMPRDPDAWFMLADALAYRDSDLDMRMEKIIPYYQKAADLYPREGSNTYRNHIGFFKKFRVRDGDSTRVLTITDEQMDYVRKVWGWCSTIMEAVSKGRLRMVNTYKVYEEEFDNTAHTDPRPFQGLFERGSTEAFFKFTGWGASDCMGHDCGPDRSASINMGLREWDVMYHEWNHSLDWALIAGELGIGVPVTHSSDWCGFQPISSMGMGHKSSNRYYTTPGMYQFLRGSDPYTTKHVEDWLVSGPFRLMADTDKVDDRFSREARDKTAAVTPPDIASLTQKPVVEDGYVDFKKLWPDAPKNAFAFAHTYVYSPKKQKVRMWLGADDNIRVWLNGRLVHKGVYWAVVLFQEAKEKDQVSAAVMLEPGWNSLIVQITNAQHGEDWMIPGEREDCWGFSVRFCDHLNREVPGLRWQSARPADFTMPRLERFNARSPKTYRWEEVADDYTMLLPELTLQDLRDVTGYRTMTANDDIFFDLSKENVDPAIARYVIGKPDRSETALNNQLNWFFSPKEMAAVVRYSRGGQVRDLLFLRPEAYDVFLRLMPVRPEAAKRGIERHADQVIGYFLVPREDSPNGRVVLVVDTFLGNRLPTDEADLLDIGGLK